MANPPKTRSYISNDQEGIQDCVYQKQRQALEEALSIPP